MNIISKISIILTIIALNSCNANINKTLNHRPDNEEFKYYSTKLKPEIHKNLNTSEFYYISSGVYQYLAFHDDGLVSYFGGTAMSPDTISRYPSFTKPERKKNGQPKNEFTDFGFFITAGDSVKFTIHKLGVLGAQKLFEYKGLIYPDSIVVNQYQLTVYETDSSQDLGQHVFYVYQK